MRRVRRVEPHALDREGVEALERPAALQNFPQGDAERVNIDLLADLQQVDVARPASERPVDELGRGVLHRPHQLEYFVRRRLDELLDARLAGRDDAGHAEIADLHRGPVADEDVGGLDVAVEDPARMQVVHAPANTPDDRQQIDRIPLHRPARVVQQRVERAPGAVLHDQVDVVEVLAQRSKRHDVVVRSRGQVHARLVRRVLETVESLDGDGRLEVPRRVDVAFAARTEQLSHGDVAKLDDFDRHHKAGSVPRRPGVRARVLHPEGARGRRSRRGRRPRPESVDEVQGRGHGGTRRRRASWF